MSEPAASAPRAAPLPAWLAAAHADLAWMRAAFARSGRSLGYADLNRRLGDVPELAMARDAADRLAPALIATAERASLDRGHVSEALRDRGPYYREDLADVQRLYRSAMADLDRLRRRYVQALAARSASVQTAPPAVAQSDRQAHRQPFNRVFSDVGDFRASAAAEAFLDARGFSLGIRQAGSPRGILFGRFVISKWRSLDAAHRRALHGWMVGDGRRGPVTVTLFARAPDEAHAAIRRSVPGDATSEAA